MTTESTPNPHVPLTPEEKKARQARKKSEKEARKAAAKERLSKRPSSKTFIGEHKWLGGAVDPKTGDIFGIPSHAISVICISPPKDESEPIQGDVSNTRAQISTVPLPNEYKDCKFKWLRGIVHEGYLYGIPAWSTYGVLKVRLEPKSRHTRGPRVKVLPLPKDASFYQTREELKEGDVIQRGKYEYSGVDRSRWMWHGGQIAKSLDGEEAIYCIPSNAEHVLKVNLKTEELTEIGPALTDGQNKFYGGIKGLDGCIYGMPYTATGVIRIDPRTDSVEILGEYPIGGYKWHGGLLAHSTGVIYAFPAHANEVLCVDTNIVPERDGDQSWRVSTIPIQRHDNDTDTADQQYKWLGGSYGADGCIYGMPSDATSILRIDPFKNEACTFGNVPANKNKWQGGSLSRIDNCIYAVPADHDNILRIDTNPDTPLSIDFVGEGFDDCEDKWQGSFVGRDDRIYAIPENCSNVMVITPSKEKKNVSVDMLL